MFNFLKRILGNNGTATITPAQHASAAPAATAPRPAEKPAAGMEVASLSLRTILEKLPPDLKPIVNQLPDADVKVVLPVSTIMKQLSGGAVKMSLASLLRQAPPGVFRKTEIEEKRMVDVPLSEVFKTVNPARLQRRADQRQYDVPENAAGLFGHSGQTRSVTPPTAPVSEPAKAEAAPVPATPQAEANTATPIAAEPKVEPMKVLKMPGLSIAPPSVAAKMESQPAPLAARPDNATAAAHSPEPARPSATGELVLSFVELASTWPEEVRNELTMLTGDTRLVLPVSAVSGGLQKGKVSFPWSQVRMWFRPGLGGSVAIPEDLELAFPLKIVAPAFVAATGAKKRREGVVVDQTLPDFFGPTARQAGPQQQPVSAPTPEPAAESVPIVSAEPAPAEEPVVATPTAAPAAEVADDPASTLKLSIERPAPPAPVAPALPASQTLADLFNQPAKPSWTPGELVEHTCRLPGVAGAVVALEEGLVVAHRLPEGLAAETFAAFMPQIFGKLGHYMEEMKLGETNEITFQSASGPCHFVRNGKFFFATLGRPGETLPAGLHLIPAELAAHHQ